MNNSDSTIRDFVDMILKEEHIFLSSTNAKDSTMPTKILALYEEVFGDEDKQSNN